MNGMRAMLRKEVLEIRYTSRKWVLPAIISFIGILAAVVVYYLPQLSNEPVDSSAESACAQFLSMLSSIALLGVITTTAGLVSSEVRSGTAVLVVTKPVARSAFVFSKIVSQSAVVVASGLIGTAVFAVVAYGLFGSLPLAHLLLGFGLWVALALMLTAAMVVLSARFSGGKVSGMGVGLYLVLNISQLWDPLREHSPVGIARAAEDLLRGNGPAWQWPLATSLLLCIALVLVSGKVFARRDI
jgi:ABC-2 type transport system permease protein